MNILLFHPDKDTRDMLSFCLESQMGVLVKSASNHQEAIDYFLGEDQIDLVITSQQAGTEKLFKYLLSTNANIPFIIVSEDVGESLDSFPDLKIIGKLRRSEIPDKLMTTIRSNFESILSQSNSEQDYCRINTELLVRVIPLKGDIYIRLSSVKFVKLFRVGMTFTSEDLNRYLVQRKVSYLYIKKNEVSEFVQKFRTELNQMIEKTADGDNNILDTVAATQETVKELIHRLGFTPEVQELAKENVKLTLKAIGTSPKLSKTFSSTLFKSQSYISDHSVQLANIACSIAANLDWPSNTTLQKLVLAALFHDIVFQNPEHAKISTLKELNTLRANINDQQYEAILNHTIQAADLIKSLTEIPGEVDIIVAQHHERPDGTGFPRKLSATQIAPLACVLIIAHDILDSVLKDGDKFDLSKFLKTSEGVYRNGFFRKIWKAVNEQVNPSKETKRV